MFSSTPVVTVDPTTVANFSSAGCWQDSATDRVLTGSSSTLGLMTTAQCVSSCSTQGFIYAGLEASFYCYCGNTIASSSLLLAASSCTSPCGGNSTEICGGPSALSIYSTEAVENTDSSNSTWTDEGCWVFNGNDTTTLSGLTTSSSAMTQSLCRSRCDFGGYAFAGLQGDYCYCANTMGVSSVLLSSYCTWQCSGSSTDICGGSGTMSLSRSTSAAAAALPAAPGWTALGCRSDSSDRTLLDSTQVVSSWMTDDWCIRSCESHGYTLAGLEDGNECYCGNEMSSTSTYLASSSCYKTCPGLGSKQCGGAYALTMFQSPSSNNDPVYANATVSQYMSLGCWSDTSDHQTLGASVYSVGVMTHEICLQRCSAQGSTYAGLQGYNCYCGDSLKNSNLLADSSCTTTCGGDDFELCGGYLALTVYGPEQLAAAANSTWTDVGCWLTTINGVSALSGSQTSDGSMTLDLCQSRCAFGGFAFSGVGQYNCYCGDSLSTSTAVDARYCDATCPGDSSKTCGGAYGMSVYRSSTAAVSLPASNTWTSLGCRSDSWTRTLDASTLYSSFAMTLDLCIRTCDSANYTYAGVEDGTECYCGNSVLESSTYLPLSSCTYSCGGFSSSICGGYWALSLYQKSATDTSSVIVNETTTAYSPVGCWSDTTDHTALTGSSYSIGTMTQDTCKQYCSSKGFTYAGVEGFDCFCGNSLAKSNILLDSSCTTSCAGNTTQTCGGSQAMTVFGPYSSEESTDVWSDVGCWITSPIDVPVLNGVSSTYASMTQTLCTKRCESAGYAFAGTSGNTCYCGSSLSSSSDVSSSLCSTACPGDSSESCGGSSAMTVSKSSLFTNVNIPSISGWSDAGCYTDNWDRTLSGDTLTHSLMTPLLCTQYCSSTGYSMAGVEGGTQCYCGSSLNIISTTSLLCSTPCGGLSTALCGGSWAIEVYSPTYTNSTSGHSVPSDIALSNQCLSPAQATARASASATQTTISASASATATGVTRRYNLEDTVGRSYRS
ncbi:beta-1,6-N-acetylglucosaminyltransferase, contains WSC domain [Phaffia rhodozyma]|uniref:Beta-1,6-N-acetylglucosaminyltransferase, contains WSC domain n=1 Tax=Phaffia rhodozyma TaxID=264483 RepID=A0A0F7SHT6_PHARH|nr:beta-1,6-N-acetylglucosaminyltransferase, contains WSC domain [Phaffia rhodozyma]